MYSLYSSYGVDVGTLFLTGFLSSALFGMRLHFFCWSLSIICLLFLCALLSPSPFFFRYGFLSGTVIGSFVDKFGRRRACLLFCILEVFLFALATTFSLYRPPSQVIINSMERSRDFRVLIVGRLMGGVSTSLLFSAFESWLTAEHEKR